MVCTIQLLQRKILTVSKFDNIHINLDELDSFNKPVNIIQSCRSSGKTTLILKKIYKKFIKYGYPSLIIRRRIVDITESYITDTMRVINKFAKKSVNYYYKSGDIKNGIIEIYTSEEDFKYKKNPFIRILALSTNMMRLKGGVLPNLAYMLFDEFIINLKEKETYLQGEIMRFMEVYSTYSRESKNLRAYLLGNTYSYYSPYHAFFKIDTDKIKMGEYIITDKCVYYLFKPSEQLIEHLKKENALLGTNSEYDNYNLYGLAINDKNIKIEKTQPLNFKLIYIFKIDDDYISIYKGYNESFNFWVSSSKINTSKKAIYTFNLYDVTDDVMIPSRDMFEFFYPLKRALMLHKVAFNNTTTYYLIEMIYNIIPKI